MIQGLNRIGRGFVILFFSLMYLEEGNELDKCFGGKILVFFSVSRTKIKNFAQKCYYKQNPRL